MKLRHSCICVVALLAAAPVASRSLKDVGAPPRRRCRPISSAGAEVFNINKGE